MISIRPAEAAEAIDSIGRVLSAIQFRGIFSAEFKQDPRDGYFKLLEINARPWWYIEFAERCGIDVCDMAYRDAMNLPVESIDGYRVGERMVYPYYDYFACRDEVRAGRLTTGGWLRSWIGAQQPLFNWSDPRPAWGELRGILRRRRWNR